MALKFALPTFWQPTSFWSLPGWLPIFFVANEILPTLFTLPSQILPTFWPTWGQEISNQYFD
jgi:hypothetical protein